MEQIAVLSAGSWGTALSLLLAWKGYPVSLWVWSEHQAETIRSTHENPYLPGCRIPENISITTSMAEAVRNADKIVFAAISSAAIDVARTLKESIPSGVPVISATKGLDGETGLTISQTLRSILGEDHPLIALSGPNLAVEVAKKVPTATVAASIDESAARDVQRLFMCPSLRVYTNSDIIGVELAGALKNIIALGAGIGDGLGYGDNTKATLLTRGLAEITRLGIRLGAKQATFMGLAGVGDLMATCASPLSRNRRVGLGLGSGRKLDDILKEIGQVAEGIPTCQAAYNLSSKLQIPMPITEQIYRVVFEGESPQAAVENLMMREPKDEIW
jgi:glycerol-3-phosphate dehydrogenase (NAD(P)+)